MTNPNKGFTVGLIVMLSKCPTTACMHVRVFPGPEDSSASDIHLVFVVLLKSISFLTTNIPLGN